MKIIFLLIIPFLALPRGVNADYFKRQFQKQQSAMFHGLLFCRVKYKNLSMEKMSKISDNYISKKGLVMSDLDQRHWNGAQYYGNQVAPKCKPKKDEIILKNLINIVSN